MTSWPSDERPRHAFLSYVHEDRELADQLEAVLGAYRIPVWRDTASLWPGQDWRLEIREAITAGSLAFIACFSASSVSKERSYQNEELILAVDEIRLRQPGRSWLIPVRFSACELPAYDLGANRTLDSLLAIDLDGDSRDTGVARLVSAVLRIFGSDQIAKQHVERGRDLRERGDLDAALATYTEALRVDRGYAPARLGRYQILLDQGRQSEAADTIRTAEAAYRESIRQCEHTDQSGGSAVLAAAYRDLAQVLEATGRSQEAEHALRAAISAAPGDPMLYSDLGRLLRAQERYSEAEAAARRSVKLDPSRAAGYLDLGHDLRALRRFREAALAYREAIALDPAHPEALAALQSITTS